MKHTSRKGFTLIELMVVIGIILVLVAIVVLGLRHVNYTAARHETIAEMKICADLLNEYKTVNQYQDIEGPSQAGGQAVVPTMFTMPQPWNFPINLPVFFDVVPSNGPEVTGQPASMLLTDDFAGHQGSYTGGVFTTSRDMGDKLDAASARYYSNAVAWTQAVNFILMRDSKNRATVTNSVPPKRILETPVPPNGAAASPTSPNTLDAPIILDGWGNPIVFVPRGGMHVMLKQGTATLYEYVVRSSGTYLYPNLVPPLSANDRPFFASAGQDGVFTDSSMNATAGADYAIDNIYSFQE